MAKLIAAAFAAVVACVGTYGLAATPRAESAGLGAGSKVVTACGDGMTFAYTTAYDAPSSGYVVNGVDLSNIPAGCRNRTLSATFYDHSGITVGSTVAARLAGSGTSQSIAVAPSSNAIDAGEVDGVSVVVS